MPTVKQEQQRRKYIESAHTAEKKYGLPENILVGVMGAESNFNPNAVSHAGAKGLMQFMTATAKDYGIDPLNPEQSIDAAGKYLARSYKEFGNWDDALKSYNLGVGGVKKWKAGKRTLPKETADYTGRVYKHAGKNYSDNDNTTYANSVAPYINQASEDIIIPNIRNFDYTTPSSTFTTEASEEAPKKVDENVAELEQKSNEKNFVEDFYQARQEQPQEEYIIQAPRLDVMGIYNKVSNLVDAPLAQEGGSYSFYDLPINNPNILTPENFTLEYMNSPKYKERLIKSGYNNPSNVVKSRIDMVNGVKNVDQNGKPNVFKRAWNDFTDTPYSMQGSAYDPETNTVIMDTPTDGLDKDMKSLSRDIIKSHELGHAEINGFKLNDNDEKELFERQKTYKFDEDLTPKDVDEIRNRAKQTDYKNVNHAYRPYENKSDLNALRYQLKKEGVYDAGKQDFNKQHLKKLKSNSIKERLLKNYTEEDLIWLMNNIASNEDATPKNIAQEGGRIPVSSRGVYEYPNSEVIVPTESGKITMKNIPYPILGIDEYGNKQMMYPSGEYQFQGKTIHEIPQLTDKEKSFLKAMQQYKNKG